MAALPPDTDSVEILRRIRRNRPSNQTIHFQYLQKFSANNNKMSNGRITSGYSFRRDFTPDPQKVSIHSKSIIEHKQTISKSKRKSRHITTHNDLPAEW
jgi:hypothetical protein